MDELKYYNSPITLEQAEQYIQNGLITAARAYVANGYYLRRIRDDKLFEESGYQNFEDYVRGKYNKDKGWASKCIKVNQQLSDGGDSPILSKQYLEYSTYQLVELAYMTEEQREEADSDMTVNQLKQIRKPEEVIESEESCDVTTSESEEKEQDPEEVQELSKLVTKHFFDRNENASTGDAYGWIRSEVVKEYLRTGYKGPEREYEISVYGDEYRTVKGEAVTVFYNCSGDDRPAAVTFDVENTRLEREYNFFFGDKAEFEFEEPEEEQEDLPRLGFYNPDDDSLVDESYSLANISRASDRHVAMFAQLFVQDNAGMLFHGGVFYGIRDEEIIRMLKLVYHARKENPIMIDNDVEVSVGAEIIEFSRGDEDLGICLFQKFSNYVRKQIDEYVADRLAKEKVEENQENVIEQPGSVPESSKTVIDGEFVELILPEPSLTKNVLEEAKKTLKDWLSAFEGEVPEKWPPFIERQKIIVAALEAMAEEQEQLESESEPEPVKQEQPELPILKNNDQRAAFVDAYETWPIWIETKETGERYYRYDLSENAAIVVKVYWKHSWESYKESKDYKYGAQQYYLMGVKSEWHNGKNVYVEDESRTFYECGTNRSALVDYLKEFQKGK